MVEETMKILNIIEATKNNRYRKILMHVCSYLYLQQMVNHNSNFISGCQFMFVDKIALCIYICIRNENQYLKVIFKYKILN